MSVKMECFTPVSFSTLNNKGLHSLRLLLPDPVAMASCRTIQPSGLNAIDAFSASHCFTSPLPFTITSSPPECSDLPPSASTTHSQSQLYSKATQLWLHHLFQSLSYRSKQRQSSRHKSGRTSSYPPTGAQRRQLHSSTPQIITTHLPDYHNNHSRYVQLLLVCILCLTCRCILSSCSWPTTYTRNEGLPSCPCSFAEPLKLVDPKQA